MSVGNRTIVFVTLVVAVAAIVITALVVIPGGHSSTTAKVTSTSVPKKTVPTLTTASTTQPPPTTVPPTTQMPRATTLNTGSMIYGYDASNGQYDVVAWQPGDTLGIDNGPYYCCNPPAPDGSNYSGSAGCSGSTANSAGQQEGGYMMNGKLC